MEYTIEEASAGPGRAFRSLVLGALAIALACLAACGGEDATGPKSCSTDTECELGQVCLTQDNQCAAVPCTSDGFYNCLDNQICYVSEENPEGTCSAPQCTSADDCTGEEICAEGVCLEEECTNNDDCPGDDICNLANQCEPLPENCTSDDECPGDDLVCSSGGSCRAGCTSNEVCAEDEYCDTENKICAPGCRDSTYCPLDDSNAALDTCSEDNRCVCSEGSCPQGTQCISGGCADVTSCSQVDCAETEYCDPDDGFKCKEGCTTAGCDTDAGLVCDEATQRCVQNTCGTMSADDCTDANYPYFDASSCSCVQCRSAMDCDTDSGEICNQTGECAVCDNPCDPNDSGYCPSLNVGLDYCIGGCCSECIGDLDCDDPAKPICDGGFCRAEPTGDCSADPTICPSGYECNMMTNSCEQSGNPGGMCNPLDPQGGCPQGQFCDPNTSTCTDLGGSAGCGLCNDDCTCPNDLSCNTLLGLCTGCTEGLPPLIAPKPCPTGQSCTDLLIFSFCTDPNAN